MSVIRKGATKEYSTGWEKAFGKSGKKAVPMKAAPAKAAPAKAAAAKKAPVKKTAVAEKAMPKAAVAKVARKGAKTDKKKAKAGK